MSNAIANQLYLAYLGRPADTAWRSSTTAVLAGGAPSVALQNAFYSAAVLDGAFSLSDSSSALVNKIFLNVFGFAASTFEQNAWAVLINNGTITTQTAAWTIFASYLGATNVPASYQVPAQSKLLVIDAYTNQLANDSAANIAVSQIGSAASQSAKAFLSTITSQATAAPAITGIAATVTTVSTSQTGSSFTFTTGVDNLTGTSGNDTFTADNTGGATAKQLSVADQINGGSGTDTLKIFLSTTDTATGQPTLTSIETVYLNGGVVTAYTAATGTTTLQVDSPVVNTAATYTVSGQAVALLNHNVTASTTTTVAYGSTATSAALTLTGETRTGAAVNTIDVNSTSVATLALTSATTANVITLANTGAALKTINVDGAAALTLTAGAAVSGQISTFNAANATGAVSLNTSAALNPAAFAFTGGSGNDTLTLINDGLGTITAGTQLVGGSGTDKIGLFDTALTAGETAKLNAVVGFETVGLNANITLDEATLTSFRAFSVDTAGTTSTISNLQTGTTVAFTANTTAFTLAPAIGVNSTAVSLTGGVTVGTLTTTGLNTLAITSSGTTANVITSLVNNDNSSITITGARDLTVALVTGTATGSSLDGSGATGVLTLTGSGFSDIIKGGTGIDRIRGDFGATTASDTLTGGAGADTFVYVGTVNAVFTGSLAAAATVDRITDFVAGTDKIALVNAGTTLTSVTITAVTVATAADVAAILTAVGTQVAVSTAAASQVGLITVSAGAAAGTYLLVNDLANVAAATDTLINITGVTGTVTAGDFVFA